MSRRLAILCLSLAVAQLLAPVRGHASGDSFINPQVQDTQATDSARPAQNAPRPVPSPNQQPQSFYRPSAGQTRVAPAAQTVPAPAPVPPPPQIIVNPPAPAPSPWTWHDRIAWAANIILVVLGYFGILLALRTLKNIERQTEFGVTAARAALECANAALESAQAIVDSERPWIVVSVEPFLTMENSFKVIATNRGRTPARLVATTDHVKVAADETHLPAAPEYDGEESNTLIAPTILLPGESVGIRPFRREDVQTICGAGEELHRIELWEEKIFLYGRVGYRDMIAPADQKGYETNWCCWYVHGEKTSALVMAGPPAYNTHT